MSELPRSSPYRSRPDEPVTEAERERLGHRLNSAYETGAVDGDDYRRRLDLLYAAQRLGELVPVAEGLPPAPTHEVPAIVASGGGGRPGELAPLRPARTALVFASVTGGVLVLVVGLVLLLVLLA